MTRRRIGIVGGIIVILAFSVWVLLPKQRVPSVPAINVVPVRKPEDRGLPLEQNSSTRAVPTSSFKLWTRPTAKVAARHLRRTRFAPLRRLGASEQLVDRLTDGEALEVVTELRKKAQRGDSTAANIQADLAHSLCPLASPGVQEAQALPGNDLEWINAALQEKVAFNKQLWAACQTIDQKQVDGWVAKSAERGNGASLWLSSFGGGPAEFKQKLVEAVDAGYPDAQDDMALIMTQPPPGLAPGGPDDGEEKLFKQAARSLPYAESQLALCEFNGCPGIAIDIPAAVSHAREAAQRGAFDAMIEIGPQVQASMIDPNEVVAWNLLATMLAQQGCTFGAFSPQWIAAATNTLTTKKSVDKATSLAEQYWREYGAQIISNIGCTE